MNTTGNYNTANGVGALRLNTTGAQNTANGTEALRLNTTGNQNTANGDGALRSNTTGSYNTANGNDALWSNTIGSYNTAYGMGAGYSITTGGNNTFLGRNAGFNANQKINVVNSMALGDGTYTTADNQVVIGNASIAQTLLNGNVGIGVAIPTQKLDVAGDVNITGTYRVNGVPIAVGGGTEWTTSGNNIYSANIGNVGIGATIPTEKLDVRGNMFLQGNNGFDAAGETAQLTLGDGNHFIKAINGGGVEIGSYMNLDPIRFTFNGIEVMKITSTGYVYAPKYIYSTPEIRYYVINPSEFTGYYYDTPFEIKDDGGSIGSYTDSGGVSLYAPVHLPTGAKIKEMRAYLYRNDSLSSLSVEFYRFDT